MIKTPFTNEKEIKRATQAAVNQANRIRIHCARCDCAPKPNEWGNLKLHYCIDCA